MARDWEDFSFLGEPLYWMDLIFFFGEGGQTIYFHKAINDLSCKLKKLSNSCAHANFSHFYV